MDDTIMPAIFFGHGSPMNAIETNRYTHAWAEIGRTIPRPRAILAISAHWYVPATAVTAMAAPPTIHDFGGFPPALHALEYPAPGDPALASEVQALLAPVPVILDREHWGLDHGTWSVLVHVYPQADVPVIQLSMDANLSPTAHRDLARRLSLLRERGVLIAGFGNVVHNLRAMRRQDGVPPYEWAVSFNDRIRGLIEAGSEDEIVAWETMGDDARLSVPTPEHYLPLIYVMAQRRPDETMRTIVDGIDLASISMLSVGAGLPA